MSTKLHLETHQYDGTIGEIYRQVISKKDCTQYISYVKCLELIDVWIQQTNIPDKQHAISTMQLFKNDVANNYDATNNIHVEEVLPVAIECIKGFDQSGIDLFIQNLAEISMLGSCPQGRTTRLLSFIIPYLS